MFGLGCLALPGVFARLGWLVSLLLLAALSAGCGYLGVLFSRLAVALPNATTFDDIGTAAMGATGRRLVFAIVCEWVPPSPHACNAALWLCCGCLCGCPTQAHLPPTLLQIRQ